MHLSPADLNVFAKASLAPPTSPSRWNSALCVEAQANGISVNAGTRPGDKLRIVEFSSATLSIDDVEAAAREFYRRGTALFVATIVTAPADVIERNIAIITEAMSKPWGRGILGIHLEGPFLSRACKGAHPEECIIPPDEALFARWHNAAQGKILWTTISPAHKNAPEFTVAVRKLGPVVSIGHHNATYQQIVAVLDAGATGITHAGNAWTKEPTTLKDATPVVLAQLTAPPEVHVMLVPDGEHVSAEFFAAVYHARRRMNGGFALVSDTSPLAGAPVRQEAYTVFRSLAARVRQSENTRFPRTDPLSGSYLTPQDCLGVAGLWGVIPRQDLIEAFTAAPLQFLLPALNRVGWSLPHDHVADVRRGAYAS